MLEGYLRTGLRVGLNSSNSKTWRGGCWQTWRQVSYGSCNTQEGYWVYYIDCHCHVSFISCLGLGSAPLHHNLDSQWSSDHSHSLSLAPDATRSSNCGIHQGERKHSLQEWSVWGVIYSSFELSVSARWPMRYSLSKAVKLYWSVSTRYIVPNFRTMTPAP